MSQLKFLIEKINELDLRSFILGFFRNGRRALSGSFRKYVTVVQNGTRSYQGGNVLERQELTKWRENESQVV